MKILERLQYIALFLVGLLIVGLGEVITGDIGWQTVTGSTFYIQQLTKDAAIMCVTFGAVYAYIDYFKNKNETYKEAEKYVRNFAISDNNIPTIMSLFLDHLNRTRKIKQFKADIRYKLFKLDEYIPWYGYLNPKNWRKIYSEEEKMLWIDGTDEQKAKSKYCKLRSIYENKLSDAYIEKYIDVEHVKFQRVTESVILAGFYKRDGHKNVNNFISPPTEWTILKKRVPMLVMSFGLLYLLASVVFGTATWNWDALIKIAVAMIGIIWNVLTALRMAKQICEQNILGDMIFRSSLIKEYEKWSEQETRKKKEAENVRRINTVRVEPTKVDDKIDSSGLQTNQCAVIQQQ